MDIVHDLRWEDCQEFGGKTLIVHYGGENDRYLKLMDEARERGYKVGLAHKVGREGFSVFVYNLEDVADMVSLAVYA